MGLFDRIKKLFEKKSDAYDKAIPADVRMISGCMDAQTSADVSNVSSFDLPDPAGQAGGACTSCLLKVLYADHKKPEIDLTFVEVLTVMRGILDDRGFSQIPQLTSSKPVDVNLPFQVVPEGSNGTKRAVLIGINYVGMNGELSGCQNDALNMKEYIMDVWGFEEENITVLLDDGKHDPPTRENMFNAWKKLVEDSEAGDSVFCHYAGHGGKLRDDDRDEEDGYDETLIPVDYRTTGQIRDDDIFDTLVQPMAAGVTMTCVMDCCHSGTVLDLPYKFKADGKRDAIELDEGFNYGKLFGKVGEEFNVDEESD